MSAQDLSVVRERLATPTGSPPRARITPNLFGIAFGLAGLAECWDVAATTGGVPVWVGDISWSAAALVWAVLVVVYLRDARAHGSLGSELRDPVFAPFVVLVTIVPMLLGTTVAEHARITGVTVFAVAFFATVGLGGWLSGQWILSDIPLARWHPGYFLPTVAGGYLAATCCAQLGYDDLARVMFGYGTVCWLVLGSILLLRLFTQPLLPVSLLPTMAIEVAPPVVAGTSWFMINGGQVDGLALGLAGYSTLMVLVQLRLVEVYRTVPFGPGWWSFSFSYAAVFVNAIFWLSAENVPHRTAWTDVLLAVVTMAIAALAVRTGVALARGTFLPRIEATA
jgi:tellurite resistance protein